MKIKHFKLNNINFLVCYIISLTLIEQFMMILSLSLFINCETLVLQILYNSFVYSAMFGFLAFSNKQQFNTKCFISSASKPHIIHVGICSRGEFFLVCIYLDWDISEICSNFKYWLFHLVSIRKRTHILTSSIFLFILCII